MAIITGSTKTNRDYKPPLVTGAPNTIPTAGQFASQIKPNFINANGSSVAKLTGANNISTAQIGQSGAFGANLPMRIKGSTGKNSTTGGGLNWTARVPIVQTLRPVIQSIGNAFSNIGGVPGVGGKRPPLNQPTLNQPQINNMTFNRNTQSVASLTGANNTVGINQYNYLTPEQKAVWDERKRREQITALTTPYTGSIAALTGANMFEPSQTGFPGTDPRQSYPISNQYLMGSQAYSAPVDPVPAGIDYGSVYSGASGGGSYGGYGGGYGGGGGYNGGGYGGYYDNAVSRVLNWRVATG